MCVFITFLIKRGAGAHSLTAGRVENVIFLYIKKLNEKDFKMICIILFLSNLMITF
jgi:hypothetical protein